MVLVFIAGTGAGTINTIVGSGTLITFPTLVSLGVPPVTATMSNAVGLVPAGITGSIGYRRELAGQRRRLLILAPASFIGALTGAYLLLHLPEDAFITVVPWLLVLAMLLVVVQPFIQRWLRRKHAAGRSEDSAGQAPVSTQMVDALPGSRVVQVVVIVAIYLSGVYGGYFAAAQGILIIGILGILLPDTLQRLNGTKIVLALVVNVVAASAYVIVGFARIDWSAAGLIAAGSLIGGVIGASVGRRLPPVVLRAFIVVLATIAIYHLLKM